MKVAMSAASERLRVYRGEFEGRVYAGGGVRAEGLVRECGSGADSEVSEGGGEAIAALPCGEVLLEDGLLSEEGLPEDCGGPDDP